ncbi:MAG: helicase C-terminal domain-containing protein [Candidatus Dormibacteria bacterium]
MRPEPASPGTLVAFDLETTGLSARKNRICEIGAVKFDPAGTVLDRYGSFANPAQPIPVPIQRLTGISDSMVQDAPPPFRVVEELHDFSVNAWFVGHGVPFDVSFCEAEHPGMFHDRVVLDTVDIARIVLPRLDRYSLTALSTLLAVDHDQPHRAWSDAEATMELFMVLCAVTKRLPMEIFEELCSLAGSGATSSLAYFFDWIASCPPTQFSHVQIPQLEAQPPTVHHPVHPAAERSIQDVVDRALGPDGALAELKNYEYRPEQIEMAHAVSQACDRGQSLVVEAGTGTGKTLAYLTPVLASCMKESVRAVIATHTIALEHQLIDNDLPLARALLDAPLTIALLKGRSNYLSKYKLHHAVRELLKGSFPGHVAKDLWTRFLMRMIVWESETTFAERSELHLSHEESQIWSLVAAEGEFDARISRPEDIRDDSYYVEHARAHALAADVVVTSHALLVVDALREHALLGEFSLLVIDEAHHLEDVTTDQLTVMLDLTAVLKKWKGSAARLLPPMMETACGTITHALELATNAARQVARATPSSDSGSGIRARVPAGDTSTSHLAQLHEQIGIVRTVARELLAGIEETPLPFPDDPESDMLVLTLRTLIESTSRWEEPGDHHVRWIELSDSSVRCAIAPTSVQRDLQELMAHPATTILTSATLSVGGTFTFFRERAGLGDIHELIVNRTDRDFLSHASCCIVKDIPPYDAKEYEEQFAELCIEVARTLKGHCIVLFTSYTALRRCHQRIVDTLEHEEIAVLGQSVDGTLYQIVQNFRSNPRAILLGTGAMWEGIDLPGNIAQCVIVAKLPFPVPTEPLHQARSEQYRSPFMQYFLPLAALRLKQGFGRLIRSEHDKGVVVIADSRIRTKEYGRAFLSTLPAVAVVEEDRGAVADYVRSIASA